MDFPQSANGHSATTRRAAARGWLLLLIGLVVVAGGSLWAAHAWQRRRPAPPPVKPVSEVAQPFLNTQPGVKYVGTARCAGCHQKETSTYAEHPMGRSVSPAGQGLRGQDEASRSFEASGLHYVVERRTDKILHKEFASDEGRVPAETVAEIGFAVGSGRNGQSFLVNRNGYLFQSPISWYARDNTWRISPGFEKKNPHFTRRIVEACLFCHTNEAHTEPDTTNRYRSTPLRLEPVGCERCHGPGELHVAARLRGEVPAGTDLTIVNPRRLEAQRREAVCQQCHLQGEARIVRRGRSLYDYRPGLALDEFVTVFLHPPTEVDTRKAVSHVEQMYLSRCFRASAGKLGCISCHDPHVFPSVPERVSWYRGRCLTCHQDTSCTIALDERRRRDPSDSCIDCHMTRGECSNVAHTAITDHRIMRSPDRATVPQEISAGLSLVPFHRDRAGAGNAGAQRDLGLALVQLLDRALPESQRRQIAHQACGLLGPAVTSAPDDVAALEKVGLALWMDKQPREALAALEKALQQAPRRESALATAARVAMELQEYERGIAFWRRLIEVNPYNWESHAYLAQTLALRQQWTPGVDACREALRLNPFEVPTRMLLIDCLSRMGQEKRAQAEFDTLLALHPPEPDRLRQWFDELMRPGG